MASKRTWIFDLPNGVTRVVKYTSSEPVLIWVETTPYVWNWLGKQGQSEYPAYGYVARQVVLSRSQDRLHRYQSQTIVDAANPRSYKSEHGDNSHLLGVKRYARVEIIRGEEATGGA